MAKTPLGQQVGRALSRLFGPVRYLYSWWKPVELDGGTSYFIMPEGIAIFIVALAPGYVLPAVYFFNLTYTISALLVSPVIFLSVLRVKEGRVSHTRLLLFLPYWITRIPGNSEFELYEAWGDSAPSGVAFTFPDKAGEYLHLGTLSTASDLEKAIGSTLKKQGWVQSPRNRLALQRPSAGETDARI